MHAPSRWDTATLITMVLLAFVLLPQLFLSHSVLYTEILTLRVILIIGTSTKLFFLFVGFLHARACMNHFEQDNPARPAWVMMTAGLLLFLLGQAVLATYQIVLFREVPYPSLGDLFFLSGTLALVVSLVFFIRAYRLLGLGGERRGSIVAGGVVAGVLLLILIRGVLGPILSTDQPPMELFLNLAYPVTDYFILLPAIVMVRLAARLKGGSLWRVWVLILAGIFCFLSGDILFAYFTTLEKSFLDPILDLLFAFGYILLARGITFQYELMNR